MTNLAARAAKIGTRSRHLEFRQQYLNSTYRVYHRRGSHKHAVKKLKPFLSDPSIGYTREQKPTEHVAQQLREISRNILLVTLVSSCRLSKRRL